MENQLMRDPGRGGRPPAFNVPRIVLGLLAVLIGIHVLRQFLSQAADFWTLMAFSFIPARLGGEHANLPFPGGYAGDVWTWVSYALLHADAMHLTVNGFWLAAFGSVLARRFGPLRFIILSILATVGGAAAHLALRWGDLAPMIGASAAISGHMGAVIRFAFSDSGGIGGAFPGDERHVHRPAPPLSAALRNRTVIAFLAVWFGLNLLLGIGAVGLPGQMGTVAWEAHIGGFMVGLAAFSLLDPVPRGSRRGAASRR